MRMLRLPAGPAQRRRQRTVVPVAHQDRWPGLGETVEVRNLLAALKLLKREGGQRPGQDDPHYSHLTNSEAATLLHSMSVGIMRGV
jgi:hypothetical protein